MQAIIPTDFITLKRFYRAISLILVGLTLCSAPAYAAVNIPLTVNLSETVNVTGTPRIAVDVGGITRYATYTSGTGSNILTFTLSPQTGDVDLDGVTVSSPIDLNGGTIKDAKGNNAALTFTPPSTTNVKVNYPSLGMDFVYDADGRYTLSGTVYNDLTSFLSATGGTFTRASIGTYFDSTGTLQTAASGVPRFDYDPVTHAAKGILIEESRTNMVRYSNDFTHWSILGSVTKTPNIATGPDGATSATQVIFGSSGMSNRIISNPAGTGSSSTMTQSIWMKGAVGGESIIVANGWGSSSSFTLTTNWKRYSYTFTGYATSNGFLIWANSGTPTIYLYGAQLEQGAFPTSYIPTTTAAVTRAADNLSFPASGWYGTTAHSAVLSSIAYANNPNYGILFEGNSAKGLTLSYQTSTSYELNARNISGTNSIISGTSIHAPGTINMFGLSYDTALPSFAVNGNLVARSSSATSLGTPTTFYLGSRNGSSLFFNGWVQKTKYYPTRIADTQLQLLTQ